MSPLVFSTVCKCGQRFTAHGIALSNNSVPTKASTQFVMGLAKHFQDHHHQEFLECAMAGNEYIGLRVMMNFLSQDPHYATLIETVRHRIHAATRAREVSDKTIVDKVDNLRTTVGLEDDQASAVVSILKEMRDILQETGPFGPQPTTAA